MIVIDFVKIALCLVLFFDKVTSFVDVDNVKSQIRLPDALQPIKYYLHITTRIHQDILRFNGNVTIEFIVKEPTNQIVLHANQLYDFEISLRNLQTDEKVEGIDYIQGTHNFLGIYSKNNNLDFKTGERYRLEILYTGGHQDRSFGFYRDTYLDDNQNVIPLAITKFEPTKARNTFPCFDEPHLKARFVISITHGSNYTAVSNMPIDGVPVYNVKTQMTTTTFMETLKMSTYLLAFAVTNYKHVSEVVNGREYGVYFPPNSRDNGTNALKNGINSLTALEQYFGIDYPLPKLDHIRVEKTYGIAMENWGLLTYNNKNFVTNIRNNSWEEMQKIISQNHEIAHQWFGNLVTPKWWSYLWLKEGFAVYFSYIATQLVFPEMVIDEYFILTEIRNAFNQYSGTHPLTVYVEEGYDIKMIYNTVSYSFGSCFVRMFHHAIGHKTFLKGVTKYLTKFQYSVADEHDLFNAFQEAINEDNVTLFQHHKTAAIMRSWTRNTGFPTLFVTRNFENGTITFRQKCSTYCESEDRWWIPLNFATASNPDFTKTTADYIIPPENEFTISLKDLNLNMKNSDWLIVDKQQTGIYHVFYDEKSMRLLAEALNKDNTKIHAFNRAKILLDLKDHKDLSVETFLEVVRYLKFEENLMVWEISVDLILNFYNKVVNSKPKEIEPINFFIRQLVRKVFHRINSNPLLVVHDGLFKEKILKIACKVHLDECPKMNAFFNFFKTIKEAIYGKEWEYKFLSTTFEKNDMERIQKLMDQYYLDGSTLSELLIKRSKTIGCLYSFLFMFRLIIFHTKKKILISILLVYKPKIDCENFLVSSARFNMIVIDFLKIALCLVAFFDQVASFSDVDNVTSRIRLPRALRPTKYYLHITTRIHQDILRFNGNVSIELTVKEPTDEIVLHAKSLYDFEVSLRNLRTDEEVKGLRYVHEHRYNFLRIFSTSKPLELMAGERYRLEILYTGEHQDTNFGFYRDTYLDDNKDVIPLAITQFEPTSARTAFPCFDEPHLKARFVISITHGSNYTAVSNMPIDGVPVHNVETQMTTTTFLKTLKMSTYIVAFAVTNYKHVSEVVNGREYGVYFPPNSRDNGTNALKNGINSLTALEQYFGIDYPLPKLDHIRVEKTYGIAMENWGLLTYNNKNFVTNIRNNSWEEMQKIISQNHEIAHQWFGNLVTPKWWSYLWLKEGFAVYFSYIATQLVFPETVIDEYFILKEIRDVFKHNYHYHPLTIYVEEEDDIRKAYNIVSYRFASCFVRMFHHAIGHKTFVKGVAIYLTRFQYSVADENDLFNALQEAIDEDNVTLFRNNKTAAIMSSWTHNTGLPIVFVTRNFESGTITFRQRCSTSRVSEERWYIPLSFATASNPDFTKTTADYIMPPEEEVTVSLKDLNLNIKNSDWLVVDKQQTGIYHVFYDDKSMRLLAEALNNDHTKIHAFNRAKLLRDLEDQNDLSVETFLEIIRYLKFEEDLLVWENAADLILNFYNKLLGSKSNEPLKFFIRGLVRKVFQRIFINPQKDPSMSVHEASFKEKILKIACEVDLSDCLKYTQKLTTDYFLNELSDDHLKSDFTLCQGLKIAAFDEFKKLVMKVTTPDSSIVKFYEFLFSLKCVKSLENIQYFLETVSNNENATAVSSLNSPVLRRRYSKNTGLSMLYLLNVEARPMIYEFLVKKDKQTAEAIRDGAINMERGMEDQLLSKKAFQKNYKERIQTWLESYYLDSPLFPKSDD
ncbi:uncharacterized protein LOC129908421 [Episyrphus balteatus]|uniref:uncharacterized protein LOC129908421 n=1 Tax=Episyrphus balteatus TaxID=286459 RepID=UPI0024855E3B|nr:uncharacterized protein LOC129908421 [Episyrphus balteatus]